MHWQYTHFIIPIIIAFIISGILSIQGWRYRPVSGAAWFSMLMLSASVFTLFYGLEVLSTDLQETIFWSQMQYIGAQTLSVMWFFLTLIYTGKRDWLTKRNIGLIFIIPAITILLAWTNHLHEWIWVNPFLDINPAFSVLDFTPGAWWRVSMLYANFLLLISTVLLIKILIRSESIYQRQVITLLFFLGINWIGTGFYVTGIIPYHINPAPITFSVGGLVIAWGLFRYQFVDITPIAKDTIINKMQEGLIVLNVRNKIVDINPTAQTILGKESSKLIGKPISEVLSTHPELEENLCHDEGDSEQHLEITFYVESMGTRNFDVRVSPLKDKRNRLTGRLMFWHDVTERVKQETSQDLLLSITQEVSTAQDYKSALKKALEIIVEHANWAFGEAWLPDESRSFLKNANASYCRGTQIKELQKFNRVSQDFTFSPNVGLPGRVWVSKKNEWQQNASTLPRQVFLRVQYAQRANLKASLGIPVLDSGNVIAVLVFYMNEIRTKDQYMIDLISVATAQLGAVLEHKGAEEMMRIQSATLEASTNGIVITNKKGRITWANPAFSQLTGYSMQEIIGENPRVLKSGQHPPEFYQHLWDEISSGKSWQGEIINRRKDKSLYVEEQTITPTRNIDGEITHFIAIKKDVTRRKEAEKALAKEQEKANALLQNILPEAVVEEIKETGYVTPILFDSASILFTDFRNFTKTAEKLPPKELINLISHYFSFFDVIIEKYNLEKLKTIGDGYMCAGGLPVPNETHALDITYAALDLQSFVRREKKKRQRWGLPYWDVRIGISSGPIIAGVVGQKKYAYDVWGDAVVMASRMEESGEVDKVNISETTYELIKDHFNCQYRGEIAAKHKGQVKMAQRELAG